MRFIITLNKRDPEAPNEMGEQLNQYFIDTESDDHAEDFEDMCEDLMTDMLGED